MISTLPTCKTKVTGLVAILTPYAILFNLNNYTIISTNRKKTYRGVQKMFGHNGGVFTFENESSKVQMRTIHLSINERTKCNKNRN